jgi:hypothetical protein
MKQKHFLPPFDLPPLDPPTERVARGVKTPQWDASLIDLTAAPFVKGWLGEKVLIMRSN